MQTNNTRNGCCAKCLKHSTKPGKHWAKAFSSVTLSKESSTNCISTTVSLPSIFLSGTRHSLCRVSLGTRQRKVVVTSPGNGDGAFAECHKVTLDKGSLFAKCALYRHSAKKLHVGPFTRSFAERIRWHSTKTLSLSSARLTITRQRDHRWAPLSVPLPSALGGTQQSLLLC
jgi:hypothetical protein